MMAGNARTSYSGAAKFLHWTMALIILGMIPAGFLMAKVLADGPVKDQLYANHEALGFIVLVLASIRIAVKFASGSPPPAASLTRFERIASVSAHHLLYILVVALPLVGWAALSAYGLKISMFGLFEIPALLPKSEAWHERLFALHRAGGILITGILLAHIGGGLMHLLVKRDGVFQRMWPGKV